MLTILQSIPTHEEYRGVARRNSKSKVHFWGISKGSKGETLDTHIRPQCNKIFTIIGMKPPGPNYNPIIRKQSNYMVVSCLPEEILEIWFKKTDYKNGTIWVIFLASRPSSLPSTSCMTIMLSFLTWSSIYFRNVGTIKDFKFLKLERVIGSLMTIHWESLKFSLIVYPPLNDIRKIMSRKCWQ